VRTVAARNAAPIWLQEAAETVCASELEDIDLTELALLA
jgi:hypothetical protein